jgi:PAS domain S-box-containing protein
MRIFIIRMLLFAVVTANVLAGNSSSLPEKPLLREQGDPFLRNFLPREYGAFFQNWSVIQDHRGLIYVGNSSGILEYDGVRWRLIRTEKGTTVRSLAVNKSGRVYVGAQGEFGYLAPDIHGEMYFVSLMERVKPEDRAITEIFSISILGDGVYFQALNRLFCVRENSMQVWKPAKAFQTVQTVRNHLYIGDTSQGLLVLEDNVLKPVPGGERFIDEKVNAILPWDVPGVEKEGLLIATQAQGFFLYNGKSAVPFPTQVDYALREFQINYVLTLADGTLGIGTQQGGFFHLSRQGRWLDQVGKDGGLPSESVMHIFQDSQLGLWLALGKGISRVEILAPYTQYDERRGLPGSAFSIHRHQGILYVGTDKGLFCLNSQSLQGSRFIQVQGLKGKTWSFVSWEDRLLAANFDGLYEVQGTQARRIWKGVSSLYFILRSRINPDRVFIGTLNGLASCLRVGNDWVDEGMIAGPTTQVRSMVETGDGTLWVGTAFQGVLRFSFPEGRHGNPRVEQFGTDNGLPPLKFTNVHWLAGSLKVSTHSGVYRFHEDLGRFEPDPAFAGLFPEGQRWVYALKEDNQGRIWMHSCNEAKNIYEPGYAFLDKGIYHWEGRSCIRFSGIWVESIFPEADGVVWFASTEGLIRLAPTVPKQYERTFLAMVRSVSVVGGRLIFGGASSGSVAEPKIPFADNRLRFEFALPSFDLESANRYQIFLEGNDRDWSDWTKESFQDFSNLSNGKYRFRVRAQNVYGTISSEGTYAFLILPPWYRTWWAYVLWFISGSALLFGIIYSYTLNLRRQKIVLDNLVALRTQELKDSNTLIFEANKELEKLSLVASETDNAVMIMDEKSNIEWVNPGFTRLYGLTLEELFIRNGHNLMTASLNPKIKEVIEECLRDKKSVTYEASMVTKAGQNIWAQTTLTPILDEQGHVKKLVTIDSDITKIKEAEAAAEKSRESADKANQSKSEFLSRMSHEIRTPMNGVIGFTEMLLDTELNEEQMDFARTVNRSGEALITLLNDILDFSKIEAGELTFDPIDFDPEMTVFDICDLILPRVGAKPVEILCRIGDRVPAFINSDPGRFRQVVVNLMSNAAKFTENGEIELSLDVMEEKGDRLKLLTKVRDTGIGIRQDQLVHVFEPFQQADGSTTRKYGGTGLGLSICRQISRLMGGEVWMESTLNQGSTFYFTCWVNQSQKQLPKATQLNLLDGQRALIVDDNPTNLEILTNTLNLANLKVIQVGDPKAVMETLRESFNRGQPIDICIIDIQMPGISGFDLAREIRKQKSPIGNIPLLAFSSSTLSRSKKFQDAGFNGFLPKPIRRRKLVKMVERLLGFKEAAAEEGKPEEIVTQHSINEENKHSLHILLAEDNPINLKLARFILEKAGYTLIVAMNGEEAVEKFCQNPDGIDMILMDIQMPKLDGKEATRQIRKLGYKDIPIIAMTAEAMKGDREKCIKAGMNDYIAKPIKRNIIYEMLKKYCLDK